MAKIDADHDGTDPKRAEQARLSAKKYCSALIMPGKETDVTHDFEIVED